MGDPYGVRLVKDPALFLKLGSHTDCPDMGDIMTKWSIQYGDEAGNQFERETDDIGEVHATLDHIVRDSERTAGYAGQTATWYGYEERDAATGHGTGNWSLTVVNLDTHTADGYEIAYGPQCLACGDETCTASDAHHTVTGSTEWTVQVTLEAFSATEPVEWGTDSKRAQAHANQCIAVLADSTEPYPVRPDHEAHRTIYRASGHHDVFGEWSVDLIASDNGEVCGTCGEWFPDSDTWGEHNDMAHY